MNNRFVVFISIVFVLFSSGTQASMHSAPQSEVQHLINHLLSIGLEPLLIIGFIGMIAFTAIAKSTQKSVVFSPKN